MLYYDARRQIKTGDVLVFAGPWLFSRAIRFFTRQPYSHTGIALWLNFNGGRKRLFVAESMEGNGVQIVPLYQNLLKNYWPRNSKIWWQKLNVLSGQKVADFYLQKLSDNYALPYQFIVDAIPALQHIRHWLHKSTKVGHDRYHCSELCTMALISAGYDNSKGKEPCMTSPGDVSKFDCLSPPVELEQGFGIYADPSKSKSNGGW